MRSYQQIIHEIAPDLNPAGVEASMRLEYGTLSHLGHDTFRQECAVARGCEQASPGYLKRIATSFGMQGDYERWEAQASVRTVQFVQED